MSFVCSVCSDLLSVKPPGLPENQHQIDIISIQCGHVFHDFCLKDWFNSNDSPYQICPICQRGINANQSRRLYLSGDEETDAINKRKRQEIEKLRKDYHEAKELAAAQAQIQNAVRAEAKASNLNADERKKLRIERFKSDAFRFELEHVTLRNDRAREDFVLKKSNLLSKIACLDKEVQTLREGKDKEKIYFRTEMYSEDFKSSIAEDEDSDCSSGAFNGTNTSDYSRYSKQENDMNETGTSVSGNISEINKSSSFVSLNEDEDENIFYEFPEFSLNE